MTREELAELRRKAESEENDGCLVYPELGWLIDTAENQQDEIARLKEIIGAKPPEDGKTIRVELSTTPESKPCIIVTAPIHFEEERLAKEIAAAMNLYLAVAESVAADQAGSST